MDTVYHLTKFNLIIFNIAGFVVGLSKTGIPGAGMLAVPLAGMVFPARASTGLVLPMLICGDVFAVSYYRRHAVWKHLFRLIPWAAVGIIIGYFALGKIKDNQLKPLIGAIVIGMLILHNLYNSRNRENLQIPSKWWFAAIFGLLAGVTTMMANAAGSIMILYLLAMRLPKIEFIGTGAWYYFLMNWFKVPFSVHLGLINPSSLRLNFMVLPAIVIGAVFGIITMKRIPEKTFSILMQILTAAAAVKLFF